MSGPHTTLTAAALAWACLVGGCRGDRRASHPANPPRQLTLAVAAEPAVGPSLAPLVRLVAEQELRRAGLAGRSKRAPAGALVLLLQRSDGGTNRLSLHLIRPRRSLQTRFDFSRCCAPAHVAELRRQIRQLLATVRSGAARSPSPLWKGSRFNRDHLRNALAAGVHWLLARAHRSGAFVLSDLQQVFLILREAAADPALRRLAARAGPRLALRFLRLVPRPRPSTPAAKLFDHAAGTYFVKRFGVTVPASYFKQLTAAFEGYRQQTLRRHQQTGDVARELLDDLVDLYFPYKLGLPTQKRYADVVRRAAAYPFPYLPGESPKQLEDRAYLATHIVYVLSEFSEAGLDERELARVVGFLDRVGSVYLAADDVETLGEIGDALKIVGRGYDDKLVRQVVQRLITRQNPDGSWGHMKDSDAYRRYHTTWTCFNGLLEFRFARRGMLDAAIRRAWQRGLKTRVNAPPRPVAVPMGARP